MGQATFLVGVLGEVFANGGRGPYCGKDSAGPRTPLGPLGRFFLQPLFLCDRSRDILRGF